MRFKSTFVESIGKIVREVLTGLDMYSEEAFNLVMRTGAVETGYRDIEQQPQGPALGFFQVEPATADSLWYDYIVYRADVRENLRKITGIEKDTVAASKPYLKFQILSNVALQAALCRLKYRIDSDPIPKDIEGQAAYWVRVYNAGGKGTVEKFIRAAEKMEI